MLVERQVELFRLFESFLKYILKVQFDNLKLYANGVGADFELYNAKTGIEYTDLETAKDSNTAYRLSWMNATGYEKVYSIVAEYYNGEDNFYMCGEAGWYHDGFPCDDCITAWKERPEPYKGVE